MSAASNTARQSVRELPPPRDELEVMSAEPWFGVGEDDVFPAELLTFLGLQGELQEAFLRAHGDLLGVELWRSLQERLRQGEVVSFCPYHESRRLHHVLRLSYAFDRLAFQPDTEEGRR